MEAPGIEKKALEFGFEMHDVQFNRKGRYIMRLSVQSLHTADYSGMQLRQYPQHQFSPGHETKSDTIIQDASLQLCIFDENSYKFFLPKGKRRRSQKVTYKSLMQCHLLLM